MELSKRIRAARAYANMSAAELAERTGMSVSTLARLERGERQPSKVEAAGLAVAVGEATGLPTVFFTGDFEGMSRG